MNFRKLITLIEMSQADARQIFFSNGVNPVGLDTQELKSAYRKLMMKHHPDKGGDVEKAKEITGAYEMLKSATSQNSAPNPNTRDARSTDGYSMDRPNFRHIDYVKWYFDQLTLGKPAQTWTVINFDGHFFRGSFVIRATADLFPKVAEVMQEWDDHFNSVAVMIGTNQMLDRGTLAVINILGKEIKPMVTLEFDSFNRNPANDTQFCRKLPMILDSIADGTFVTQDMMESYEDDEDGEDLVDRPAIFKSNWVDSPHANRFHKNGRGFSNYPGIYLCHVGSNSAYGNHKGGFSSREAAQEYADNHDLKGWKVTVVK